MKLIFLSLGSVGNGSILTDCSVLKNENFQQTNKEGPQQLGGEEIKVSMGGKLNKLQVYIDSKIVEIQKLSDQLSLLQKEIEHAEKEKNRIKQYMDEYL